MLVSGLAFAGAATATADPNIGGGADINTLASALPTGYGLNNRTSQTVPGGALPYLRRGQSPDPSGPVPGNISSSATAARWRTHSRGVIGGDTLTNCGDKPSPTPWHQGSSTANAGSVACGTFQSRAEIVWTNEAENVLGVIRAAGDDVPSLYRWWRDNG